MTLLGDPHDQRGLSYFQIGLRVILAALAKGRRIRLRLDLSPAPDPEPHSLQEIPFAILGATLGYPAAYRPVSRDDVSGSELRVLSAVALPVGRWPVTSRCRASRERETSMNLPRIEGVIRRRLLVNFRVDADVMARQLPDGLEPALREGHAIAGICLIRLERMRPSGLRLPLGGASENAAHRVAVTGPDGGDAVYIPRRDSDSWVLHLVGGRLFPGQHGRAAFRIDDDGHSIDLRMSSDDDAVSVRVAGETGQALPGSSVFGSVAEASSFFEAGSLGYSDSRDPERLDALVLETEDWSVAPFDVRDVSSSYFEDRDRFPEGSVAFDHALVMRDLRHGWLSAPDFVVPREEAAALR